MAIRCRLARGENDFNTASQLFLASITDETATVAATSIPETVRSAEGKVLIAIENDQAIGAALVSRDVDDTLYLQGRGLHQSAQFLWQHLPMLELIGVLPDHRFTGVGGKLLNAAVGHARAMGGRALLVVVERDSQHATFFNKSGFKILQPGESLHLDHYFRSMTPTELEIEPTHSWGILGL